MKKMIYSFIILIPIIGEIFKYLTKDYAVGCSPFMDDNGVDNQIQNKGTGR